MTQVMGEKIPPARPEARMLKADYSAGDAVAAIPVAPSDPTSFARVRDRLDGFGFAVLQFPAAMAPEEAITALADHAGLGAPYVPVLYRQPETSSLGDALSSIQHDETAGHPGFATRAGQPWHVDGTLEPIGAIRVSALYCVRAAVAGGHTRLFNAVAAFHELRKVDTDAARVLLDPTVLRRISTILREAKWTDGPAFSEDTDGSYMNRFSEGPTARWFAPEGKADDLDRALSFFRARADEDRYTASVLLEPAQCLVFRNDRVSHCREEYIDNPEAPRKLVRALFEKVPA
jgi:alpha-ketoglutarate-dependent taurine dioxygenase